MAKAGKTGVSTILDILSLLWHVNVSLNPCALFMSFGVVLELLE